MFVMSTSLLHFPPKNSLRVIVGTTYNVSDLYSTTLYILLSFSAEEILIRYSLTKFNQSFVTVTVLFAKC
jgi:hypothetical protein